MSHVLFLGQGSGLICKYEAVEAVFCIGAVCCASIGGGWGCDCIGLYAMLR